MSDRLFNDRDGAGKTIGRKLEDRVNDPLGFRTVIVKDGDNEVMLRTKGGRPELTVKKPEPKAPITTCVKSPLTEIAFKYHATTAQTGYRRWYGEPDPVAPAGPAAQTYQYSSDGLFALPARKLQKISFKDANLQNVDFLFAEQPVDPTTLSANLPATSVAAAASTARFKFIEGKYPEREWYPTERSDIGWAFTSPATAVKFFIKRVKSIKFSVTDTMNAALGAILIKWKFAYKDSTPLTGNPPDTGCANQNAEEVSFPGREFYAAVTDGNMEKLTMRVSNAADIRLDFKKPGSFIAVVDPENATGNTRPADKTKAIDLCEFSGFGNPYHGLVWNSQALRVVYSDKTKIDTVKVKDGSGIPANYPDLEGNNHYLKNYYYGGNGAFDFGLRYYNFYNVNPFEQANITSTDDPYDGFLYMDAVIAHGLWYVGDHGASPTWNLLDDNSMLYKDGAGNCWEIYLQLTKLNSTTARLTPTIRQRYGVLGSSEFRDIMKVLPSTDFAMALNFPEGWKYRVEHAPNAKEAMILVTSYHYESAYNVGSPAMTVEPDNYHVFYGVRVVVSGDGALLADALLGIGRSDGISVSATMKFGEMSSTQRHFNSDGLTTSIPIYGPTNIDVPTATVNVTCTTVQAMPTQYTRTNVASQMWVSDTLNAYVNRLDIFWENGEWVEMLGVKTYRTWGHGASITLPSYVRDYTGGFYCFDPYNATYTDNNAWVVTASDGEETISWYAQETASIFVNGDKRAELEYTNFHSEHKLIHGEGVWYAHEKTYSNAVTGNAAIDCFPIVNNSGSPFGKTIDIVCVNAVPKSLVFNNSSPGSNYYNDYWQTPKGFAVLIKGTGTNGGLYPTPSVKAKMVYHSATLEYQPHDIEDSIQLNESSLDIRVQASYGFAYDYRKKELISVPYGALAYFV